MLNKANAVSLLVEERLPLFTETIRIALAKIKPGPALTPEIVVELIKQYPDHFAELVLKKTKQYAVMGKVVWINPDTGREFHDVDIDIIYRYLRVAYSLDDYLYWTLPHDHFLKKYQRFSVGARQQLLEEGKRQDTERFFSLPDAIASPKCMHHWSNIPYLTSDECAALAMGRDPEVVSLAKIEAAVGNGKSEFLNQYRKSKKYFESHQSNQNTHSKITSKQFQKVIQDFDEGPNRTLPPEERRPLAHGSNSREFSLPAVRSLYRIVIALAMKQYPDIIKYFEEETRGAAATRNPNGSVITQMEKDLRPLISTLNDGNIKEYLRRAYVYAKNERLLATTKHDPLGKIPEK